MLFGYGVQIRLRFTFFIIYFSFFFIIQYLAQSIYVNFILSDQLLIPFYFQFISDGGETELSFSKNGRYLGVAFRVVGSSLAGRALYPHVLCKNCSVSLNLDSQGVAWYPGPPGFCSLTMVPSADRTRAPLSPSHRKDCEVQYLSSYLDRLHRSHLKALSFLIICCISIFHTFSFSGADDGWHARFWKEPLGREPHGHKPREALQRAKHKRYPSLHEGEQKKDKKKTQKKW